MGLDKEYTVYYLKHPHKKGGFMKNIIKTFTITLTFLTLCSVQAFANNVNSTNPVSKYVAGSNENAKNHAYIEKSNAIRAEINAITVQIKELKEYNSNVSNKLKSLNEKYKEDKNVISSDTMKKIKELRKSIKTVDKPEKTITEDDSIKSLVQNKEYDKALEKLNETLENKKTQLKTLQERNAIWRQIDALIG